MLAIPRKQRAMVRKGIARQSAQRDRHSRRSILRPLCRQPAPARHATAIAALLRDAARGVRSDCEIAIVHSVRRARRCPACCRSIFATRCLPYYAGDLTEARDLAANDFKYWDLMRRACERGLKVFDYGRSKRGTGSFDFKKNWGFEPATAALRTSPVQGRCDAAEQPEQPQVPGRHRTVATDAARGGQRDRPGAGSTSGLKMAAGPSTTRQRGAFAPSASACGVNPHPGRGEFHAVVRPPVLAGAGQVALSTTMLVAVCRSSHARAVPPVHSCHIRLR